MSSQIRMGRQQGPRKYQEASTVFGDLLALTIYDPLHSEEEDRFVTLGESEKRRLIVVSFTDRDDRIRIIKRTRGNATGEKRL